MFIVAKRKGQNYKVLIDPDDYEWIKGYTWHITKTGYAETSIATQKGTKHFLLHRMVNKTPKGYSTDHINRDRLDNRKDNLRTVTSTQNFTNTSKYKNNKSGFKGVSRAKRNRWRASIQYNKKVYNLGDYDTRLEAAIAYDCIAIQLFGEYAGTNLL